jgi:hypothetical protein
MPTDDASAAYDRLSEAQRSRNRARQAGEVGAQIAAALECGRAHFELNDLGLALRLLGEGQKLIEESGLKRELLPEIIGLTGRTHQRMKHWDQVLGYYSRAAGEAAAQGLFEQQLRWTGKEATTRLDMNDMAGGVAGLEKSIELGRSLLKENASVAVELSQQIIRLANTVQKQDEKRAEQLWREAQELLDRLPPSRHHFLAAVNRATYVFQQDKKYLAWTYMEEALEIGRQVGMTVADTRDLAQRLAVILHDLNEHERAGDLLMKEFGAAVESHGDLPTKHKLLTQAVDCYFAGNLWTKMKAACIQLREFRRHGSTPKGLFDVEIKYSIACRGLGEVDESLASLKDALRHAIDSGDHEAITQARGQTTIMLVERGDYAEAVKVGYELWAQGQRDRLTTKTLVRALIGAGKLDAAAAMIDEGAQSGLDELTIAHMKAHLADAGRGDPTEAWYAVGRAAREGRTASSEAEALTRLIQLYKPGSKEQFEAAKARLRLIEPVRTKVADIFSESSWQAVTEHAKEFPGYLDGFLEAAIAARRHEEAIYELERFRSQALVDAISERGALWSMGEVERGWFKSNMTDQYQRARYQLAGLVARKAGWRARREAALEVERLKNWSLTADGIIHFDPVDRGFRFPTNLKQHLGGAALDGGEILLFLHALANRTVLWAIDAAGDITHTEIPGFGVKDAVRLRDELRRGRADGRSVRGHWRDVELDEGGHRLPAVLDSLEEALANPLTQWLNDNRVGRVFLVAGTAVTSLAIDCCPSLIESPVEICFLPTGKALGFARAVRRPLPELLYLVRQEERDSFATERMTASRGKMLMVVDPTRTLQFGPMEAAMVAGAAASRELRIMDQDVVLKDELAAAAGGVEVLHFVGHGAFNDQSPYRSGLYIGRQPDADTLWTNAEVFSGIKAPAGRLAVLSGCETGRTRPNLISEEVSLPAAFLAAGYSAVICSRWPVDDLSTTLLMGDFYARWNKGGVGARKALKESAAWLRTLSRSDAAQIIRSLPDRLRAIRPEKFDEWRQVCHDAATAIAVGSEHPFSDPDYWAAFFVAGDGAITSDGPDVRVPRV